MKKSKFIKQVDDFFGTLTLDEVTKKQKIELLVKKLHKRYKTLKAELKKNISHELKDDIKESLNIIKKQIKKGKKLLK